MKRKLAVGIAALLGAMLSIVGVSSPAQAVACSPNPCFFYNQAQQTVSADGASAQIVISKPFLASGDFHSLVQIGLWDGSGNTVELGYNVDRTVNGGSSDPHIFVAWFKNGVFQCYNTACPGYNDYAANTTNWAGQNINSAVGTQPVFGIISSGGNWWFQYGTGYIGYISQSNWTAPTFTKSAVVGGWSELASAVTKPCSDMANGVLGLDANPTAVRIGSLSLYGTVPAGVAPNWGTPSTLPAGTPSNVYTTQLVAGSVRTFKVGGPGWNAAGTGAGTIGSC
jgi:hypothetical protein